MLRASIISTQSNMHKSSQMSIEQKAMCSMFTIAWKVIYKGSYVKGNKVNIWDILCEGKVIGGGQYDDKGDGIKMGDSVEATSGITIYHQVICKGSYVNGKKVGSWTKLIKSNGDNENDFLKLKNNIMIIELQFFECTSSIFQLLMIMIQFNLGLQVFVYQCMLTGWLNSFI
ncbi:unnamed protein product [Paramecium octaurelia]|uniref:Uncharacterized protein n=1 Tax=Paramecium octaurelia TaxID=43137 RepID=A0A8S1Y0W9_PAROT|nr:unnamed protein product [Paramecium octaurelia]